MIRGFLNSMHINIIQKKKNNNNKQIKNYIAQNIFV